jgi:P pilus assembly protein, pilin FimA
MQIGYSCGSNTAYLWYWSHKSFSNNMMDTNLSGVGYKIKIVETANSVNPGPANGYVNIYGGHWSSNSATQYVDVYVEVYKTAPTIQSGHLSGEMFYTGYTTRDPLPYDLNTIYFPAGVNVSTAKCSLSSSNMKIALGDIPINNFTGVGSTTGSATSNLVLDCDPDANISVSLQANQNPDAGDSSVLALTGQGAADVASGVGVQFLYNGTPMQINNRIALKRSAGGQETLPITARYYQTRASVTTGSANASATLDLTYQ